MAEIALRAGEALRIDAAGRVLVVAHVASGCEIRVSQPGLVARVVAWWRARRQQALLEELDARTLKDIGLAEFATRIKEQRRLEARLRDVMWY
jgi:uncharacterized protein YjiS (DUF1127 family)